MIHACLYTRYLDSELQQALGVQIFTLGGSWSGPKSSAKDAEVYTPGSTSWNGKWDKLKNIQAKHILTNDPQGVYRADNYGWFFAWSGASGTFRIGIRNSNSFGSISSFFCGPESCQITICFYVYAVFHAGPSTGMHWFTTNGEGNVKNAGIRPGGNSANGGAVMFDAGKILTFGGSEAFAVGRYPASTDCSLIELRNVNQTPKVTKLSGMKKPRVYANSVVLADGKILSTGGASKPREFWDGDAHYQPGACNPHRKRVLVIFELDLEIQMT